MSNIYEFQGHKPVIDKSAFIHPMACIIGNVFIGRDVYIGPGAVLRGDWGSIIIEDGCNVQENCVIHMFPDARVHLHKNTHMGHCSVVHGATIGYNALIGMNAVVMDNAEVGRECVIGALSFVPANMIIPDRKLAVGSPAKIIKDVTDEFMEWKNWGTALYQSLPAKYRDTLKACKPLRKMPEGKK